MKFIVIAGNTVAYASDNIGDCREYKKAYNARNKNTENITTIYQEII